MSGPGPPELAGHAKRPQGGGGHCGNASARALLSCNWRASAVTVLISPARLAWAVLSYGAVSSTVSSAMARSTRTS